MLIQILSTITTSFYCCLKLPHLIANFRSALKLMFQQSRRIIAYTAYLLLSHCIVRNYNSRQPPRHHPCAAVNQLLRQLLTISAQG